MIKTETASQSQTPCLSDCRLSLLLAFGYVTYFLLERVSSQTIGILYY